MPLNELQSTKEKLPINLKTKYAMCVKHKLELNFCCEICDQLVCHYCIMKGHLKHDHDTVKKMATKHRKQLGKIMEPVEKMIKALSVTRWTRLGDKLMTLIRKLIGIMKNYTDDYSNKEMS